jgi:hypothetical protein
MGQFSFANVASGAFQLSIASPGFATQTSSGVLGSGETRIVPQIALAVAANVTDVQVALSRTEVAQEQVKDEEKQRVFGVIPNFYVTYDPHPVALTSKQKFELAWKDHNRSSHLRNRWRHCGSSAGAKYLQWIRTGRIGLCKALRRRLRRLSVRNFYRQRDTAFPVEARSPLLLQGQR